MTFCLLTRRRLRPHALPPAQRGFVLPLAIGTSAVLLLSSASFHSLALHARLRARSGWQEQQQRDQLRSAAMAFVQEAASSGQACLLAWPSPHWHALDSTCPDPDPAALQHGSVDALAWTLHRWQPTATGAQLQLVLKDSSVVGGFTLARRAEGYQLREGLTLHPLTRAIADRMEGPGDPGGEP